ncbi:hypothetical protein F4778DRAFT_596973 [Xylariomycetidae sp. FL2044]|nr:hypothetical protein F4778DRAFT_596973 [Xylariomycetidae sp. FL2044]
MCVGMTMIRTRKHSSGHSPLSDTMTAVASSPGPSPKRHCFKGGSFGTLDAINVTRPFLVDGGQASRACEKCRASKRKCDKKLPFCDRCKRLNAKCHYLQDTLVNNQNPQGAQVVLFQPHSLVNDVLFQGSEPLMGITASHILSLITLDAGPDDSHTDWRISVNLFFRCIHPWYAVVHPGLFNEKAAELYATPESPSPSDTHSPFSNDSIDRNGSTSTAIYAYPATSDLASKELALLILTMHLTIRMRLTDAGEQHMYDGMYRTAKRMLSLLLVSCSGDPNPSLELVQCAALIALYEYGHGDALTAYWTLSQVNTVARLLGIRPGQIGENGEELVVSIKEQETGSLWWGMFILEQFIHQDECAREMPFIMESPTPNTILPETPPMTPTGEFKGYNPVLPHSMLAPSTTRHLSTRAMVGEVEFGSFQLSAKTSSLFHRALLFDQQREKQLVDGRKQSMDLGLIKHFEGLDAEIRQSTCTLLKDCTNWGATLDCFAMLTSSLFILYLPYLPLIEEAVRCGAVSDNLRMAMAALRFACQMSTDISCKINAEYVGQPQDPVTLCAPAGATCYLVIVAFSRFAQIYPEESEGWQKAIAEKFESLQLFSFRWGIAEKMMARIEKSLGMNRNDYLSDSLLSPPPRNSSRKYGR